MLSYFANRKEQGAMMTTEGVMRQQGKYRDGFFVGPTLFKDMFRDMVVAQDEVFGPVAR